MLITVVSPEDNKIYVVQSLFPEDSIINYVQMLSSEDSKIYVVQPLFPEDSIIDYVCSNAIFGR